MAEETPKPPIVLRYVGASWLPGVPARDLTADDLQAIADVDDQAAAVHAEAVKALPKGVEPPPAPVRQSRATLIKSGLYEPVSPAKDGK